MGGGGKGGGGVDVPQIGQISPPVREWNPWTERLGDYSTQLMESTSPLRETIQNKYFEPFLEGNYNPETMPGFAPQYDLLRGSLEGQYGKARENILASTPRGGAMTNALAGLEYQRARDTGLGTSQLSSNIIGDLWNKANDTAWKTAPGLALGGLGTAGGTYQTGVNASLMGDLETNKANLASATAIANQAMQAQAAQNQAETQSKGAGMGGLGAGLGSLLGMAMAPFSGGTSLLGAGISGLGGMMGKGAGSGAAAGSLNQYLMPM